MLTHNSCSSKAADTTRSKINICLLHLWASKEEKDACMVHCENMTFFGRLSRRICFGRVLEILVQGGLIHLEHVGCTIFHFQATNGEHGNSILSISICINIHQYQWIIAMKLDDMTFWCNVKHSFWNWWGSINKIVTASFNNGFLRPLQDSFSHGWTIHLVHFFP